MADTFARMRQLIGTTAEWAANDLILGLGELGIESVAGGAKRMKLGDGVAKWSQLPYFDPGVFDYVLKDGDTMSGPLVVPELTVQGPASVVNGLEVIGGNSSFGGPVNLGAAATAANPGSLSDNDNSVATTAWVQQQVGGIITGLTIKGTWNAATNTPPLANGGAGVPPAERGDFYIVSVAGSTSLDGINTWNSGDTVVFNGVTWQRVPQTLTNAQIIAGLGYTPVNKAGDTMTGGLVLPVVMVDTPAGQTKPIYFRTAGVIRWGFGVSAEAESGGNAGSNIFFNRHDDAGAYVATPLSINRATGVFAFGASPTAPTPAAGDNSTKLATTAYVQASGAMRLVAEHAPASNIAALEVSWPDAAKLIEIWWSLAQPGSPDQVQWGDYKVGSTYPAHTYTMVHNQGGTATNGGGGGVAGSISSWRYDTFGLRLGGFSYTNGVIRIHKHGANSLWAEGTYHGRSSASGYETANTFSLAVNDSAFPGVNGFRFYNSGGALFAGNASWVRCLAL